MASDSPAGVGPGSASKYGCHYSYGTQLTNCLFVIDTGV